MPQEIPLARGYITLVNDEDFDRLKTFKWQLLKNGYLARHLPRDGQKQRMSYLHREILSASDAEYVDHIDGNKLNNKRGNLRICTQSQNGANRKSLNRNNQSGVRGVSWHRDAGKWRARIMVNRREIHLGLFENRDDAIQAWESAATKHFGEFISIFQIWETNPNPSTERRTPVEPGTVPSINQVGLNPVVKPFNVL